MANFDLSIRNKLAICAGVGVLLVAAMLVNSRSATIGPRGNAADADSKQLAAVEALRAADDLRSMQIETREIRLAIAPSEVDRALHDSRPIEASAAGHIETALDVDQRCRPTKNGSNSSPSWSRIMPPSSASSPAAAKDYGDTVDKVKRTGELGDAMNALIETTTAALDRGSRGAQGASGRGDRVASTGSTSAWACSSSRVLGRRRRVRRGRDLKADPPHWRGADAARRRQQERRGPLYRAARRSRRYRARRRRPSRKSSSASSNWRAAEKETARRTAEQRQADMQALAGAFESTVASVVRSVSSSSIELEAAAEALSTTAGATRDLSGQGAVGVDAGLGERAVGSLRDRTADRVGRRDQPTGAGIDPDRARGRGPGRADRRRGSPNSRARPAASATSSS